jgi:isoleucyl-tRNA synthetase
MYQELPKDRRHGDPDTEGFSPNEREQIILEGWKLKNIFRRSIDERSNLNVFSFYEGPPTVNGAPGIHHVFSRTIKDVICRYKTMQGFRVERKAGWDTHGLPVEIAIEKELGIHHKSDIEKLDGGIARFNEECKRLVYSNIERDAGWKELTERMGYWVNMDDPYITCTNDYVESVWWAIKKFHDKRLIYKAFKVQAYCPRCETALSSHEVALGYNDAQDPSVYVKFKLKNSEENAHFLVWTTTPWTLPSNVALAVNADANYVKVLNHRAKSDDVLILAEALLHRLDGDTEVIATYKGEELLGTDYEPLFTFHKKDIEDPLRISEQMFANAFKIVPASFVSLDDGTGIVHIAPAFGEDDLDVANDFGIPTINNLIDKSGRFTSQAPRFEGLFFKEADPVILAELKDRGILYKRESITHTYPFCWRCDTPLMYWARYSWYIKVSDIKSSLILENQKINWQPKEIGVGRFGNWLTELKDWAISRERYWGTPLPIWYAKNGRCQICIGNFDELFRERTEGVLDFINDDLGHRNILFRPVILLDPEDDSKRRPITDEDRALFDPHRPNIDQIAFEAADGSDWLLKRTPEVIDVWFDSGSMPFAQHHFMGETAKPINYPADYISEGIDQTRGWFYTMHAINTFLFGERAYKNVIVNDMLLDKKGQKMSKSKGNIVDPFSVMTKYGADATRWYLLSAAVPWKPRAFNEDDLGELERKLFGTLTNTYGFFALYANIDSYSYDAKKIIPVQKRAEVDRWILSKLNSLVKECQEELDAYDLTRPARAIQEFVMEQLSNWYIRRNRRRFWKGEQGEDKQAAYDTLYECLLTISKLMAPLAPFFSDWMYQALSGSGDSVHLALYPEVNDNAIDAPLERRMESAQIVSSLVRQMRERAKLRVRQPLSRILIPVARRAEIDELRKVEDVIRDEVNVKRVEYVEAGDSDVIKLKAKANFKSLGSKLGAMMKAVAARVQKLSQDEIRAYQTVGSLAFEIDGTNVILEHGDIEIIAEDVEGWLVSSEGAVTVALDTAMTPELLSEGMAREFVNRVQNLRKDSGFDVTDRIEIFVTSESSELMNAVQKFAGFIQQETLANGISSNALDAESLSSDLDILGYAVNVQIARTR